jgi:hypothetical protein
MPFDGGWLLHAVVRKTQAAIIAGLIHVRLIIQNKIVTANLDLF